MFQKSKCGACSKELTGAIESTLSTVGEYVFVVQSETSDCNWTKCTGCKKVVCKQCRREQRYYCCSDGRTVDHERARVAVAEPKST